MTLVALSGETLARRLQEAAPDAVIEWNDSSVWVRPEAMGDVASFLHNDAELDFTYLNAVSAIDFVEYFELVYHLTSMAKGHTGVIRSRVYGREEPTAASVVKVWRGADFQEREIWDLMGVRFTGHPNMKRIMLWEGFEGHPLRKDFL
ncbi:MAG: NADH-quinone oxidoreductase subunit C [Chloroflexi bacterium]|nr:NADH-quinone oxidoreductase subunit C [Chloroflexota bacterium]MYD47102.1 NADH-quinone oxidoreductase subunit C [Chloroflexota bacterium]